VVATDAEPTTRAIEIEAFNAEATTSRDEGAREEARHRVAAGAGTDVSDFILSCSMDCLEQNGSGSSRNIQYFGMAQFYLVLPHFKPNTLKVERSCFVSFHS
jgi:hypothetical protein